MGIRVVDLHGLAVCVISMFKLWPQVHLLIICVFIGVELSSRFIDISHVLFYQQNLSFIFTRILYMCAVARVCMRTCIYLCMFNCDFLYAYLYL